MEESFDTYSKRTGFYKFMRASGGVFIVALIAAFFHSQLNDKFQFIVSLLFLLTFPLAIAGIFIWKMKPEKLYIKIGSMILTSNSIILLGDTFLWENIKYCEITAYNFKGEAGRSGNDGTHNKISVLTKSGESYESKFVINSIEQRNNLAKLLKLWKGYGYKIISNGIDLI